MADHSSDEEEQTISTDSVVTKYKMASEMINKILKEVLDKSVDGASVLAICEFGDQRIEEETAKVFKKEKELHKGIAFPTCVSVNNCICHFSPLKSENDVTLKTGDVIKVDLGAHVDGYIAVVAHTHVIGASKDNPVTGKMADAMLAAHYASEVASRLVKPTSISYQVTDAVQKVAESFGCKPIEGMLSHQLHRDTIDGDKVIIQNPTESQKKETPPHTFEMYDVFAVDVIVSTGEGKGREEDARTTVFKKRDIVYQLKLKTSRTFFSEMDKRFALMPFTLRAFEDEKKARMGVVECVKHGLCDPYPVIFEREGEIVAQFKFTVLLMPSGPLRITGGPAFDPEMFKSDKKIEDEQILDLLSQQIRPTKKQNKKKKKAAGGDADQPPSLVPLDLNGGGACPCPHSH